MHRPSPATAISIAALFVALSGTAYAATGGNFILGNPNSATSVTSLTNTAGTALGLNSKAGTAPLSVGNSVLVPKLNASLVGGKSASSFLAANGTAANSNQLGGVPASRFTQGATGTIFIGGGNAGNFLQTADGAYQLTGYCDYNGATGGEIVLYDHHSGTNFDTVVWWNPDGVASTTLSGNQGQDVLGPDAGSRIVVIQVTTTFTFVVTFIASLHYDTNSHQCVFSGHVLT